MEVLHRRGKYIVGVLAWHDLSAEYTITPDGYLLLIMNEGRTLLGHIKDEVDPETGVSTHLWAPVNVDTRSLLDREIGARKCVGYRPPLLPPMKEYEESDIERVDQY